MKELVFATSNKGKLGELQGLVGPRVNVLSAQDFRHIPEVVEDAPTFEGNAEKKARAFSEATGRWALADDSGLCVDFLNGAPGVHSARYAENEFARIEKLLAALNGVPLDQRSAKFVCVLCLVSPEGQVIFSRGECPGKITFAARGSLGFGYDPIFELPSSKTMAELSRDEKSLVSHRGLAFEKMRPILNRL